MLAWDAVTVDRCGQPEFISAYVVLLLTIRLIAWIDCDGSLCPVYSRSGWTEFATVSGSVLSTPIPSPPTGGIDWWRVEAVDAVGNRSDDPQGGACP
jgi:hypothetical protein